MRLLVISWQPLTPVHSGYRKRAVELFGALAKRLDVLVVAPKGTEDPEFVHGIEVPRSWRGRLPKGRLWETFAPSFSAAAEAVAKDWRPDRVLAEGLWACTAGRSAARSANSPLGVTVQNIESVSATGIYPAPIPQILRQYERKIYRQADWLVCMTGDEADFLRKDLGQGPPPILIAPNGTHLPRSRPDQGRIETVRESWGITSEETVAVFLGRMNYPPNVKGLAWFSKEVYPLLSDREPPIRWIAVGDPIPKKNLPPFQFVGFVEDLDAVCAAATLAISPIKHGSGTSIKVLDLLARGVPIVATPESTRGLGGLGENGVGGDAAPDGFAQRIDFLLDNKGERDRLGGAGAKWVGSNATWDGIAERFAEDLRRL